ncbi:ABC transporter ATP-binding protein [Pyrococcus yayanosii]|uniref:Iron (III) ABC transporter, atp-binding protein n=1 Tax=Pyrococcus yayanosii (strain CH1 / JCM 16557) TaxID=529709 RepID=F8AIK5_PYRYC|nr:ABC transporter ATP-binding protein [Pyrococcus yayanosii]AEH24371.1 iron (III) ABC transporter, atp-binding protein [Pyrococcus yayanosii CH1]
MPELSVEVSFSYGRKRILEGASFSARKGELLSIIGPNGAGKSTLLKCIVGILRPTGRVSYDGVDLLALKPRERACYVAYVPQSSFPEFAFTVEEFVEMGTYATGGDVRDALERVGLWERRGELITRLSGGEYQLALIARALAQGSDVLLLDEPTSHLDVNHAVSIMELLEELKEEKVVVTVLHDLNLALQYSDRIVILREGRVFWEGRREELEENVLGAVYGIPLRIREVEGRLVVVP